MSTHYLPIYAQNAEYRIFDMEESFSLRKLGLADALDFCSNFRILAIAKLFLEHKTEEFALTLHRSATAFTYFLEQCPAKDNITSQMPPFFDAIASGDQNCAVAIARLACVNWNKEYEYEEDFLYMRLLMDHFILGQKLSEDDPPMLRYIELSNGQGDARHDIFLAILNSDSDGFEKAIGSFLLKEKDRFERFLKVGAILPEQAATEGNLSIEGLALVKLAEMKGLHVENDYLFIPSSVRKHRKYEWHMNDWRTFR